MVGLKTGRSVSALTELGNILQEMIEVACSNTEPSLQTVALFSLGNMASFPDMVGEMRAGECELRIQSLRESTNPDVKKNCDRLLNKLAPRR